MQAETTGTLVALPTNTTINTRNGEMKKWEFVLNIPGQVERKVAFQAFGDKGDVLEGLMEGEELNVKANVESREYNSKWYTNVVAWSIKVISTGASTGGSAPRQAPSAKPAPVATPAEEEDLPF